MINLRLDYRNLTDENFAVVIFDILRANLTGGRARVHYYPGQLSSIKQFEIEPFWQGFDVIGSGIIRTAGDVIGYGGETRAPRIFDDQFERAVEFLWHHNLITVDPSQNSRDFVRLSVAGNSVRYREDDLTFCLERTPEELFNRFQNSIYHITGTNTRGDQNGGTGFLFQTNSDPVRNVIVTCRHCLDLLNVFVHIAPDMSLPLAEFTVRNHPMRDLAVLEFTNQTINQRTPLKLWDEECRAGSTVVLIGYPTIPQRQPVLAMTAGNIMAPTVTYRGDEDYLTFTNLLAGGNSGGPLLNLYGYLVGVAQEVTQEQVAEGVQAQNFGHAIPGRHLTDFLPF